jgi:hypothetical protein
MRSTVQHCIHVYAQGDVPLGNHGRVKTFALCIASFDERVRSEPAKLQRLINIVVRMKLELPDSAFPHAVLLNMGICYESDVPLSTSFTGQVLHGGRRSTSVLSRPLRCKQQWHFTRPTPPT